MLNKKSFFLCTFLLLSTLAEAAGPFLIQAPPTAPITQDALTVTDIAIDKTDKNAVAARDQAILEAKRTAFHKFAERSMTPEAFKAYKFPDDQTIAPLIKDFEIKNEQLAANRYAASFTVRFNPTIYDFLKILPETMPAPEASTTPSTAADTALPSISAVPRSVLVLPYFEEISGKKLLWEDTNAWREAWQAHDLTAPPLKLVVPVSDIADISAGSSDAVWAADYSVLEKLRLNYGVNEVAIAVANKSGIDIRVNLYLYRNGQLEPKQELTPYTGTEDDKNAFKETIAQVTAAIQASPPPLPSTTEAATSDTTVAPATQTPPTEKISLETIVNFSSLAQWLEVQKRLSAIAPPVTISITSLSKTSAQFTASFNGSVDTFKVALAEQGLTLNDPVIEVDEAVLGSSKSTQKPLYELTLVN